MNVVEVDYSDLCGKKFNGYELHQALRKKGINATQIVKWKDSNLDTVSMYANDRILDCQIRVLEDKYSIQNLLFPYAEELMNKDNFQNADIVHYHLIHKGAFSLLDIPKLMSMKKSVWTIHDPWIITGNCVHPLECLGWQNGCRKCGKLDDYYFKMNEDNAAFMWNVKKAMLSQVNPTIVVSSDFMMRYIQDSPITGHFSKIYKIPFGVDTSKFLLDKQDEYRKKLGIPPEKFVLAFRCDDAEIKGCKYIYEAMRLIGREDDMVLLCVGDGVIPDDIRDKYRVISLGWIADDEQLIEEFYVASDLFIMPSLAESFGLMAVEAMAAGCLVICFANTAVAEIINAPSCGIAVEYRSAPEIANKLAEMKRNRDFVRERGLQGRKLVEEKFRFDEYVNRHIRLYEKMMEE